MVSVIGSTVPKVTVTRQCVEVSAKTRTEKKMTNSDEVFCALGESHRATCADAIFRQEAPASSAGPSQISQTQTRPVTAPRCDRRGGGESPRVRVRARAYAHVKVRVMFMRGSVPVGAKSVAECDKSGPRNTMPTTSSRVPGLANFCQTACQGLLLSTVQHQLPPW